MGRGKGTEKGKSEGEGERERQDNRIPCFSQVCTQDSRRTHSSPLGDSQDPSAPQDLKLVGQGAVLVHCDILNPSIK